MTPARRGRLASSWLCCLMAVGACAEGEPRVTIRAAWSAGQPLAQLEITALPIDPDRLLDSLARHASYPRPTFPELEREIAAYTPPPTDDRIAEASRPWRALRDTVERLADALNAMDRRAPDYAVQYERFRTLYTRLAQLAAERDAALRRLSGPQVDLAGRALAAAESLRTWEYETYAGYPAAAAGAVEATGREVEQVVTNAEGVARLRLNAGRWWILARHEDPHNPFQEYYWNVPATVTEWLPIQVPLTPANAVKRWRH